MARQEISFLKFLEKMVDTKISSRPDIMKDIEEYKIMNYEDSSNSANNNAKKMALMLRIHDKEKWVLFKKDIIQFKE